MDTVHEPEIAPILIIEDDVGLSTLIKDIVNDMGLSTLQAFNGSSAMDILQKQPIELMLLDFSLPDISGMQILDTIREEELYMPPFIVITGTGDEQLAVEMMKTGAYDYLTKDAHFLKSIPAVINFALREKDAQRKLEFAEKALHESEAYNKILFQESSIPMAVLDPVSLQFVDSNKAGANIFHIESPEQLLGKTMLDVSASTQQENKTSKEHFLTYIQQARNEDSVRFQWRCQYSDGSKWDAELLLVAIHYKNRELMQFSLQDITEKLAKEKNKTLSELQRRQSQKMKEIQTDVGLIAMCGLYCAACGKFLKGKCPGCHENKKASWCGIRICCFEKKIASCADCDQFDDVMSCKKYNSFMAKLFGFIFKSDRAACVQAIRENGYEQFAADMAKNKVMTFKRK